METLIRDALKDFDTFKELTETIPLEVLTAEAEALSPSQQLMFQEYERRLAAHGLADKLRQCETWQEVEEAIASNRDCKNEAWSLLTSEEKERIRNLKIASAKPIDPNSDRLNGKRVFVSPGSYRLAGEGVVEVDRGFGGLRVVEVRMPNGLIQSLLLTEVMSLG